MKFENIKNWYANKKKRKCIDNIRREMLFFGHDVSDMTDEEIEEGAIAVAAIIVNFGSSARAAAEALSRLGKI